MYLDSAATVDGGGPEDFEAQIKIAKRILVELCPLWEDKNILMKIITHVYLMLFVVVCLFSWRYNPSWLYFLQPGSGL
jgi:hypothetical protein